ncbi:hypothetical protein POVWA2_028080 [Plasmodium ovale wallikeri]|uniref:Uncharacterized protein n=1 Tax=Plasmodium ovale wallikeri TaxID=864142 RepID=A0A1A8YWY4_PLAOA|nr:hypothetical protein POVWA2_028080 [Plasmodium ovale wallikeri]
MERNNLACLCIYVGCINYECGEEGKTNIRPATWAYAYMLYAYTMQTESLAISIAIAAATATATATVCVKDTAKDALFGRLPNERKRRCL